MIMNVFKMARLAFMLFVFLHFCAVVNVFYGMQSFGWIQKDVFGNLIDPPFDIFTNQYYFMTSTMTTVGYGDQRAKRIGDGSGTNDGGNMVLVIVLQFFAMAVFAYVKDTLFSLKFRKSSQKIIQEHVKSVLEFVNEINSRRGDKNMPDEIWNDIAFALEVTIRYSFDDAIKFSPFYKDLTPILKERLITQCLYPVEQKFSLFFQDFQDNRHRASRNFIRNLLISLECQLFPLGSSIVL